MPGRESSTYRSIAGHLTVRRRRSFLNSPLPGERGRGMGDVGEHWGALTRGGATFVQNPPSPGGGGGGGGVGGWAAKGRDRQPTLTEDSAPPPPCPLPPGEREMKPPHPAVGPKH